VKTNDNGRDHRSGAYPPGEHRYLLSGQTA
jgi:hypothetical protein